MDEIDILVNDQQDLLNDSLMSRSSEDSLNLKRVKSYKEGPHYCEECGEPIPLARRKALPGVRYCVDCAESIYG